MAEDPDKRNRKEERSRKESARKASRSALVSARTATNFISFSSFSFFDFIVDFRDVHRHCRSTPFLGFTISGYFILATDVVLQVFPNICRCLETLGDVTSLSALL